MPVIAKAKQIEKISERSEESQEVLRRPSNAEDIAGNLDKDLQVGRNCGDTYARSDIGELGRAHKRVKGAT